MKILTKEAVVDDLNLFLDGFARCPVVRLDSGKYRYYDETYTLSDDCFDTSLDALYGFIVYIREVLNDEINLT